MRVQVSVAVIAAAMAVSGCSSLWPFGGGKSEDPNRVPPGVTEYSCAQGKRLLVRYAADGKSAWVIYPDREFRLDRVASGSGERFTNGVSTLATQGDEALLDAEGARQFTDCKRKQGS